MQSSLVLYAWTNQMSVTIASVPDRMLVSTRWACSLISSFKDVTATLKVPESSRYRTNYIGKNKNKKDLGFLLYRLHCQKNPITFQGFWQEMHMCEKDLNLILVFSVSGAHVQRLAAFDHTCTCAVCRGPRVIPWKVTSHVTKNQNNTGERGASVYIGKKKWKTGGVSKNHTSGVGFWFRFFAVFRGSCLATSNEKLWVLMPV